MRLVLACVVVGLVSCSSPRNGLELTLLFDATVSDASLAAVKTLVFHASGDETGTYPSSPGRALDRTERVVYRLAATTHALAIEVDAIDDGGATVASGGVAFEGASTDALTLTMSASSGTGFTIGGVVVGLKGSGLVLQDNAGDDLQINANGDFKFPIPVESGKSYDVTVKTPPSSPSQMCSVAGGAGFVQDADVSSVVVNCGTNFLLGGTVSGLGGTLVLNNGADSVTVTANGSFSFSTPLPTGAAYNVTIGTPPSYPPHQQSCVVTNGGSGTMGTQNVSNVMVACTTTAYTVGGTVSGLTGTLVLQDNGGDDLSVTANGGFTFATKVPSGSAYAVTIKTQPAGQKCAASSGTRSGTVGSADVTSVAVTCYPAVALAESFNAVTAPALPAGWSSTILSYQAPKAPSQWTTTTSSPVASAPNAAMVPATYTNVTDIVFDSPSIAIATDSAQLSFNNFYATEFGGDGGLLEISIGGAAFTDLIGAGGSFVSGGYPRAINGGYNSPIGNRNAWTGTSNTFVATVVNLPPSCAGKSVIIRWHFASDNTGAVANGSWTIDDVVVSN